MDRLRSDRGEQEADAPLELDGGLLERRFVARAGIAQAPVHRPGVLGAYLADPIAERDHDVEAPAGELVEVLGARAGDVEPAARHRRDRVWVHRLRAAARAPGAHAGMPSGERLGHLGAGAVA